MLRNKNELYSLSKSKIRDKDFSQYESDEFVYYFKDQFLKGKNIIFISDNSVPKGNAELAKFSNGFFDLKNKTYKAKDTSINIKKSTFDNSKNDPRIKGVSSESKNGVTKISKAIFTSCEIREDKCPPWSIRANEIIHDKIKKQLIYNQATLQVYDKPVMYFPKFFIQILV